MKEKGTLDYKTEQKCSTTDEIVTDAERDKVKTNFEIKPMEVQNHNVINETRNTDITNKTESLMEWIDRQLAEAELKSRSTIPKPEIKVWSEINVYFCFLTRVATNNLNYSVFE